MSATYDHNVIGSGPAGLTAAMTLARSGAKVRVYERAETVGHRFNGDFQGLENWSTSTDALTRLADLGVEATFAHQPFHEITFYDTKLRPSLARSTEPLFYAVRRGPENDTLDRALAEQARSLGVDVLLGTPAEKARRGDIVAIGPRHADGIVAGYVFETNLEDQAHCVVSESFAPAGYAYLLIWDGRGTLATVMFRNHEDWLQARSRTVETFTSLVPGLDLDDARTFSGFGSVFDKPRYTDEAGRLFVGEAAGLQDPEWGFGMWHAMKSGFLAARSLIEGFDYQAAGHDMFESRREAAFFNRMLYERLPAPVISSWLRHGAQSRNPRERLRRHWVPNALKSRIARAAMPSFTRARLDHHDRACHSDTCDCVWCTHGQMSEDHDDRSHSFGAGVACGQHQ